MKGTIWSQNWGKSEAEDRHSSEKCMVTKIEGIMPGSARIWTEMKQTKMQEKLFCSLLPSK